MYLGTVATASDDDGLLLGWRPMFHTGGGGGKAPVGSKAQEAASGSASAMSAAESLATPPGGLEDAAGLETRGPVIDPMRDVRAEVRADARVDPRDLESIRQAAHQEGYQEGLTRGDMEARAALQERLSRLDSLLMSLGEARESMFHQVRGDLVKIMCAVPRKILRQSLKIDPRAIVSLVGSVLDELPRQERVVVQVGSEDLKMLEEALPNLRKRLGGYTQIDVEASSQITGGGAVVVMEGGRVEATIERQLETFEQRSREWLLGETSSEISGGVIPLSYAPLARGVET